MVCMRSVKYTYSTSQKNFTYAKEIFDQYTTRGFGLLALPYESENPKVHAPCAFTVVGFHLEAFLLQILKTAFCSCLCVFVLCVCCGASPLTYRTLGQLVSAYSSLHLVL